MKIAKQLFFYCLLLTIVGALLWSGLAARLELILNPYLIRGDGLQHNFAYWKYYSPDLLQNDYIAEYYLAAIIPTGLKYLFATLGNFFPPDQFTTIVSLFLAVTFILLLTASARRLAGNYAAFLTMFFTTGYLIKNFIFADAISRSFGYSVVALGFYALISKQQKLLIVSTICGALFYPASGALMAVILGLSYILPANWPQPIRNWTSWSKIFKLTAIGSLLILLLMPLILGGKEYGRRLSPNDSEKYPETGIAGRLAPQDLGIETKNIWQIILEATPKVLILNQDKDQKNSVTKRANNIDGKNDKKRTGLIILMICTAVFNLLCWHRSKRPYNSMWILSSYMILTILVMYNLAYLLFPHLYMPSRYLLISIPIVVLVLVPACFAMLFNQFKNKALRHSLACACCLALIILSGNTTYQAPSKKSYQIFTDFYDYFKKQPANTLVAGWPTDIIETIPYYTSKAALLTQETHQVFHEKYLLEMRNRMNALINAFFDQSIASVLNLRSEFGVTHLIISKKNRHRYFQPFKDLIQAKREQQLNQNFWKTPEIQEAIVLRVADYSVLDLNKLSAIVSANQN